MPRPKVRHDLKHGKTGTPLLLRIFIVLAAVGIFAMWRPLTDLVPNTFATTSTNELSRENDDAADPSFLQQLGLAGDNRYSPTAVREDGGDSWDSNEAPEQNNDQSNGDAGGNTPADSGNTHSGSIDFTSDDSSNDSSGGDPNGDANGSQTLSGSIDDDEARASAEDEEFKREAAEKAAEAAAAAAAAIPKVKGPFFTCPDGRIGLHIVHIPLLLDQTMDKGATGVFIAGRMLMFRDFTLPSLTRQSAQGFIVYVSHDPNQDQVFITAAEDALKAKLRDGAGYLYVPDNPRYFKNKPDKMLAYPRVTNLLIESNVVSRKDAQAVTLYVTSKMDSDDAVHVDTVKMIQEEACRQVGPEEGDRLLAMHVSPKMAWFPHANTTYGVLAVPDESADLEVREVVNVAMAVKPHMQSLAIDASLLLCQAPLNCYSGGEGNPGLMLGLTAAEDCPFDFNADRNVMELNFDGAVAAALYSRPPFVGDDAAVPQGVNFTIDGLDLGGFKAYPFNFSVIKDCGIAPGELSATNLLLASIYAEAPHAAGVSAVDAQGWGAAGGLLKTSPTLDESGEELGGAGEGEGEDQNSSGDGANNNEESAGREDEDGGDYDSQS